MTDTVDFVKFNTRERAISSDQNLAAQLHHRALQEALAFITAGANKQSGVLGDSFLVTPVAGTLRSVISPGLALMVDTSLVYPESQAAWLESREIREVTHDPGGVADRYDVIEMRAGSAVAVSVPRDVFDPLTGTFSVANVDKQIKSYPEFRIVKGAESATPGVPAGSSGWMPLAYVLVPAGAVALDPDDVVYCRPILGVAQADRGGWTSPSQDNRPSDVKGGGLTAAGGTTVASLSVSLSGRFPGSGLKFKISAGANFNLSPLVHDGGGLPGAATNLYLYACPPPYPAGYDATMAAREIWSPKQIYGNSGGLQNPTRQSGCLVITSATPPTAIDAAGGPAAFASINHPFFSVLASSIDLSKSVYVGSIYYDQPGAQFVAQRCYGAIVGSQRKTGAQFDGDFPIAAPIAYSLSTNWVADPAFALPAHVSRVHLIARCNIAVNSWIYLQFLDAFAASGLPRLIFTTTLNVAAPDSEVAYDTWVTLSPGQIIGISLGEANLAGTCVLHASEWEDPILAAR